MADSIFQKSIDDVAAEITGLALAGSPNVVKKKLPTDRDVTLPAIVVSKPANLAELLTAGTNESTDVGYPVQVSFLVAENQDLAINTDDDQHDLWRQTVVLHFHDQRLPSVSEVYTCKVEPGPLIDLDAFVNRNLLASSLIVRCYTRQVPT